MHEYRCQGSQSYLSEHDLADSQHRQQRKVRQLFCSTANRICQNIFHSYLALAWLEKRNKYVEKVPC